MEGRYDADVNLPADDNLPLVDNESFDAIARYQRWLLDQVKAGLAQLERGENTDGETAVNRVLASRYKPERER